MLAAQLECLSYCALHDDESFVRVSNDELLSFLRTNVWSVLAPSDRELFEKVLGAPRSRQLSRTPLLDLIHDSPESRYERYRRDVTGLARACASKLMADAVCELDAIKLVVSTTSVAGICPPVSSIVMNHLGLSPATQGIDLSHMGCAGLIWGIELAARLLQEGEAALVLGLELTSFMADYRGDAENLLAATVFGDGVGGVLVSRGRSGAGKFTFSSFDGSTVVTAGGLSCIQYRGGTVAPRIRLETTIGEVASMGIKLALQDLVRHEFVSVWQKARYLVDRRVPAWETAVDYFVVHTAGNAVLKQVSSALKATDRQFAHNFASFAEFGNTSSTSFLYSLKRLEQQGKLDRGSRLLFLTYGSGFMTKAAAARVN